MPFIYGSNVYLKSCLHMVDKTAHIIVYLQASQSVKHRHTSNIRLKHQKETFFTYIKTVCNGE